MIDVLREEFVYSEKRARDTIFEHIEETLRCVEMPLTLSRLTREAAARSQARRQEPSFEFFNWHTAARATLNAMLGSGALLARNGEPIARSVAAQATEVADLLPEFRDVTEAFLLEVLIRRLGDITARDHTAMAHALFRQFDQSVPRESMEDRVVYLLVRLADRVIVTETGRYSICCIS